MSFAELLAARAAAKNGRATRTLPTAAPPPPRSAASSRMSFGSAIRMRSMDLHDKGEDDDSDDSVFGDDEAVEAMAEAIATVAAAEATSPEPPPAPPARATTTTTTTRASPPPRVSFRSAIRLRSKQGGSSFHDDEVMGSADTKEESQASSTSADDAGPPPPSPANRNKNKNKRQSFATSIRGMSEGVHQRHPEWEEEEEEEAASDVAAVVNNDKPRVSFDNTSLGGVLGDIRRAVAEDDEEEEEKGCSSYKRPTATEAGEEETTTTTTTTIVDNDQQRMSFNTSINSLSEGVHQRHPDWEEAAKNDEEHNNKKRVTLIGGGGTLGLVDNKRVSFNTSLNSMFENIKEAIGDEEEEEEAENGEEDPNNSSTVGIQETIAEEEGEGEEDEDEDEEEGSYHITGVEEGGAAAAVSARGIPENKRRVSFATSIRGLSDNIHRQRHHAKDDGSLSSSVEEETGNNKRMSINSSLDSMLEGIREMAATEEDEEKGPRRGD